MTDMKPKKIFVCENTLEGILTAVHMAYLSRYGHKYISIETIDSYEPELFCLQTDVVTDIKKAESVAHAIMEKISFEAWQWIRLACASSELHKAQAVYRFLNLGFLTGRDTCSRLADDHVLAIFKMQRSVRRELDKLRGFVRFHELDSGILFSQIAPKHQQLYFLGEHFMDRMPGENWAIYDEGRSMACIHRAHEDAVLIREVQEFSSEFLNHSQKEKDFISLWKTFFDHIEIKERRNLKLQMNMMPKRYWSNMVEMNRCTDTAD